MSARKAQRGLLITVGLLAALAVAAQEDVTRDPGFVDFSDLSPFTEEDLEIHISVKDPLLKLVAEATRESEPELAALMAQLKLVEVYVYEVEEAQRKAVRELLGTTARQLDAKGWEPAITIYMRRDRGYVYLKLVDGKPIGLAAMYLDGDNETVFVNIVGPIDPAKVGRLAARFNLDLLGDRDADDSTP